MTNNILEYIKNNDYDNYNISFNKNDILYYINNLDIYIRDIKNKYIINHLLYNIRKYLDYRLLYKIIQSNNNDIILFLLNNYYEITEDLIMIIFSELKYDLIKYIIKSNNFNHILKYILKCKVVKYIYLIIKDINIKNNITNMKILGNLIKQHVDDDNGEYIKSWIYYINTPEDKIKQDILYNLFYYCIKYRNNRYIEYYLDKINIYDNSLLWYIIYYNRLDILDKILYVTKMNKEEMKDIICNILDIIINKEILNYHNIRELLYHDKIDEYIHINFLCGYLCYEKYKNDIKIIKNIKDEMIEDKEIKLENIKKNTNKYYHNKYNYILELVFIIKNKL